MTAKEETMPRATTTTKKKGLVTIKGEKGKGHVTIKHAKAHGRARFRGANRTGKATSPVVAGGAVLTLPEIAAYLRLPEAQVGELVRTYGLPGRQIGDEWRFLRSAVNDWLKGSVKSDFWTTQAGAFKDDPDLDEIVQEAYRRRGRPMTDASQPEMEAG
jgi:excisionase family DNA binding protein